MRARKLTSGPLYLRSKSSKDTSSPAFTSSISWTSDLTMASTLYRTRVLSKSCGRLAVLKGAITAANPDLGRLPPLDDKPLFFSNLVEKIGRGCKISRCGEKE